MTMHVFAREDFGGGVACMLCQSPFEEGDLYANVPYHMATVKPTPYELANDWEKPISPELLRVVYCQQCASELESKPE